MTACVTGPSCVSASWTSFRRMTAESVSGRNVAAGDRAAVVRAAHPPLDERGDAVGLFEGHVEGRLADDGLPSSVEVDGATG